MTDFTPQEIRTYYESRVSGMRFASGARQVRAKCPVHNGDGDNFAVEVSTGQWFCHSACGRGGDIFALEMEISSCDFPAAKKAVFELLGRPVPDFGDRDIISTYDYTDENGKLVYQVVRKYPKRFAQRRPTSNGGWIWSLGAIERVPFNLKALSDANTKTVVMVEGEKDVLTLGRHGIVASCNSEGAGNWKPELNRYFAGRKILLIPDNDEPGRAHVLKVASSLYGIAESIKILELPNLPAKGDVSDWFAAGGTVDDLRELVKASAQEYTPDFKFITLVPSEEDKWVEGPTSIVQHSGGMERFWDLAEEDGIPTPYAQLTDDLSGGFRNGEVYIIGGTRGSGKTSLALRFIWKALQLKHGVLMFSLEMSQKDVLRRMVSIEERVDLAQLRILQKKRKTQEISWQDMRLLDTLERKLRRTTEEVKKLPLLVHQRPAVSPTYLIDEVRRLKERQPLDLICIDHMQLMGSDGSERKEYEKFTAISRALKGQVARELNVPVLVVSQVSRTNSMDKRDELEITDLRGSGALEEDAAAVMLLYHDAKDIAEARAQDRLSKGPIKAFLKLGKNRFGQSPSYLELNHFKGFTRFESTDERDYVHEKALQGEFEGVA